MAELTQEARGVGANLYPEGVIAIDEREWLEDVVEASIMGVNERVTEGIGHWDGHKRRGSYYNSCQRFIFVIVKQGP